MMKDHPHNVTAGDPPPNPHLVLPLTLVALKNEKRGAEGNPIEVQQEILRNAPTGHRNIILSMRQRQCSPKQDVEEKESVI